MSVDLLSILSSCASRVATFSVSAWQARVSWRRVSATRTSKACQKAELVFLVAVAPKVKHFSCSCSCSCSSSLLHIADGSILFFGLFGPKAFWEDFLSPALARKAMVSPCKRSTAFFTGATDRPGKTTVHPLCCDAGGHRSSAVCRSGAPW